MDWMFMDASKYNPSDTPADFQPGLNDWDTAKVTSMRDMFHGSSAFNQQLFAWETRSVTDASGMFEQATKFHQTIENWDVSGVKNFSSMFLGSERFVYQMPNWQVASEADTTSMFTRFGRGLIDRTDRKSCTGDLVGVWNLEWCACPFRGEFIHVDQRCEVILVPAV